MAYTCTVFSLGSCLLLTIHSIVLIFAFWFLWSKAKTIVFRVDFCLFLFFSHSSQFFRPRSSDTLPTSCTAALLYLCVSAKWRAKTPNWTNFVQSTTQQNALPFQNVNGYRYHNSNKALDAWRSATFTPNLMRLIVKTWQRWEWSEKQDWFLYRFANIEHTAN